MPWIVPSMSAAFTFAKKGEDVLEAVLNTKRLYEIKIAELTVIFDDLVRIWGLSDTKSAMHIPFREASMKYDSTKRQIAVYKDFCKDLKLVAENLDIDREYYFNFKEFKSLFSGTI